MKRFWRENRGSASVYFIIVLVPIFLFQALFVDLIRVRLASRENEMALKSALRSVMSRYDKSLTDYGLYGLRWEQDASVSLFTESVERNLEQAGSFQYADVTPEAANNSLKPVYTMGNPDVLKRQILQEMKVKAPVEFLSELIDKFKKTGATDAIGQAANYYDKAEKLEKLHWKREEALDTAWRGSQDLIAIAEASIAQVEQQLQKLQELGGRIGSQTMEEIQRGIADVKDTIQRISARMDSIQSAISSMNASMSLLSGKEQAAEISQLQSGISGLETDLSGAAAELSAESDKRAKLEQILADMMEYVTSYAAARAAAEAGEAAVKSAYQNVSAALDEAASIQKQWQTELDSLKASQTSSQALPKEIFQFESLYDSAYFTLYKTEAAKIPSAFSAFTLRLSDVVWWFSAQWSGLLADGSGLKKQISSFETEHKASEAARAARNKKINEEEQEKRSAINSALGEVRTALGACSIGSDPYQNLYNQLEGAKGLAPKYKAYNKLIFKDGNSASLPDNADRAADKGINLIRQIGGFLNGFRDEWMLNEFVLDKFSNRTTGLPASGDSGASASKSRPESHPLKQQEAEYVLYGFNSCMANQGAAYSELYILLFGIRTVEALMEPRNQALEVGTPLLTLLVSAAEGAVKALKDTKTLVDGGSIALFQKLGIIKVTYKDMLRLFLLLHPNQNAVMTRTQALLELNTGVDLTGVTTYVQGFNESSVRVWFMPGLMKIINRTTGFGCEIVQGRCRIGNSAVYSYD